MCKTLGQEEFGIRRTERRHKVKEMTGLRESGMEPGQAGEMGWRGLEDWGSGGVMQCSKLEQTNNWAVDGEIPTQ